MLNECYLILFFNASNLCSCVNSLISRHSHCIYLKMLFPVMQDFCLKAMVTSVLFFALVELHLMQT